MDNNRRLPVRQPQIIEEDRTCESNHKTHWEPCPAALRIAIYPARRRFRIHSRRHQSCEQQITAYLDKLADLHCTESVIEEKLSPNGHVEVTQRAKYDYLIMMSGSGDEFQLNESRIEAASDHNKQPQFPMLVTNGVATVLLVFHPYYRDGFTFEAGDEEIVKRTPRDPSPLCPYCRTAYPRSPRITRPRVSARAPGHCVARQSIRRSIEG